MEKPLILPNGQRLYWSSIAAYAISGSQITFTLQGGATIAYTDPQGNALNTQALMNALDSRPTGIVNFQALYITQVIPSSFSLTATAGVTLTILGRGFSTYPGGKLWMEDDAGNIDQNGVSYTVAVVNDGMMTATWASNGDGATISVTQGILLAYVDGNGNISNVLSGNYDAVSNIATINNPQN